PLCCSTSSSCSFPLPMYPSSALFCILSLHDALPIYCFSESIVSVGTCLTFCKMKAFDGLSNSPKIILPLSSIFSPHLWQVYIAYVYRFIFIQNDIFLWQIYWKRLVKTQFVCFNNRVVRQNFYTLL